MVVLALGAWLSYGFFRFQKETVTLFDLTILDWACVLVVAGCLQTSTQRLLDLSRLEGNDALMSPSMALHDGGLRAYIEILVGLLAVAGAILAASQLALRIELKEVWKTYRGWLWMGPLAALTIFFGRGPFIIGVIALSLLGFREFASVSGLGRDRWMKAVVALGIVGIGVSAWRDAGLLVVVVGTGS